LRREALTRACPYDATAITIFCNYNVCILAEQSGLSPDVKRDQTSVPIPRILSGPLRGTKKCNIHPPIRNLRGCAFLSTDCLAVPGFLETLV
jgi:hypothetical protein